MYSNYLSCDAFHTVDAEGFFTTTEDNQVIKFVKDGVTYKFSEIRFITKDSPIAVRINGGVGIFRISANDSDGLADITVESIQVLCPLGTKLRYDGFY